MNLSFDLLSDSFDSNSPVFDVQQLLVTSSVIANLGGSSNFWTVKAVGVFPTLDPFHISVKEDTALKTDLLFPTKALLIEISEPDDSISALWQVTIEVNYEWFVCMVNLALEYQVNTGGETRRGTRTVVTSPIRMTDDEI